MTLGPASKGPLEIETRCIFKNASQLFETALAEMVIVLTEIPASKDNFFSPNLLVKFDIDSPTFV